LVEVLISSALSAMLLAGVLSSFLFLSRSGAQASYYNDMQRDVRNALEKFTGDLRMTSAIAWNGSQSITLTVPNNYATSANQITYAFDSSSSGATAGCFYCAPGTPAAAGTRTVLARNVVSFAFARFDRLDAAATTNNTTKRVQVTFTLRSTRATLAGATDQTVSSSTILRNKPVN
jgi:Tfp pilus assembly protein PilW